MKRFQTRSLKVFLQLQEQWQKIKNHPLTWLALVIFCVVLVGVLWANPTWAQQPQQESSIIPTWEDVAGGLARLLMAIAELFGVLFLKFLEISIAVMQYNGFADSPIVTTGWVIVRDIMNIFFVMVLIIIAMGTIFGATSRFKWQQQVPRLLLFALLINFSRTICVIMIDFGQVVMLTFANAMKDIAAGNFIQIFGVAEAMRFSTTGGEQALGNWGLLGASIMSLFVMLAVAITMAFTALILIYRIVLLWVLLVLSPLAFFLGGAKDLFGKEGYEKWWKQFKCAVVIGPVLTFFIWLTLSVGGGASSNLAVTEGFTSVSASGDNLTGSLNKVLEKGSFLSLLVALGMLYAGFDAAMSFCGDESVIGGLVGRAKKYAGIAAKWTAGGAAGLAILGTRKGASTVGRAGAAVGREGARTASDVAQRIPLARLATKAGRGKAAAGLAGVAAGAGMSTTARLLSGYGQSQQAKVAGDYAAAGKSVEGMSKDAMTTSLLATAKGGKSLLGSERRKQAVMFAQGMADPKVRKELEKQGVMGDLYETFKGDLDTLKSDEKLGESIKAFEASRPDLTGDLDKVNTIEDVRKLDNSALMDKGVQKRLQTMTDVPDSFANKFAEENDGEQATVLDYMKAGKMGAGMKDAVVKGRSALYEGMSGSELAAVPPENIADAINVDMVEKSDVMVNNVMSSANPAVQQKVGQMDPAVYGRMLEKAMGINATGEIQDADKLRTFVEKNPAAAMNIRPSAMTPAVAGVVAGSMGTKAWQKAASRIQKDPEGTKNLRESMKRVSSEVAEGDHDQQKVAAASAFDLQMDALDARQAAAGEAQREQEQGFAQKFAQAQEAKSERVTSAAAAMSAKAAEDRIKQIDQQLGQMTNRMEEEYAQMNKLQEQAAQVAETGDRAKESDLIDEAREHQLRYEQLQGDIAGLNREAESLERTIEERIPSSQKEPNA